MKKRIILGIIIALILIIGALGIKGFLSKNKPNDNINENNSDTINEGLYLKEGTLTYYKNGKKTSFTIETDPNEHIYYGEDKIYFYNYNYEEKSSVTISYFDIKEEKVTEVMTIDDVIYVPYIDDEYVFTFTYDDGSTYDEGTKFHQILKRVNLKTKEEDIILEVDTVITIEDKPNAFPVNPTVIKDNDTYYVSIDSILNNKKNFSIYKVTEDLKTELLTTHYNKGSLQAYMYLDNNKLYYAAYDKDIETEDYRDTYYKLYSYDLKTKKINEEISDIQPTSPVFVLNDTIAVIKKNSNFDLDKAPYTLYLKKDGLIHQINLKNTSQADIDTGKLYYPSLKILSDNTLILGEAYSYRINIDDLIKNATYTLDKKDLISDNKYYELTIIPLNKIYNQADDKVTISDEEYYSQNID